MVGTLVYEETPHEGIKVDPWHMEKRLWKNGVMGSKKIMIKYIDLCKKTCHATQKSNLKAFRRFEKITQSCPTWKNSIRTRFLTLLIFFWKVSPQVFLQINFHFWLGDGHRLPKTVFFASQSWAPPLWPANALISQWNHQVQLQIFQLLPFPISSFPALASPVLSWWWIMSRPDATVSQVIFRICRNSCMTSVQYIFQTRVQ